jgi:hypothetical protein
MKNTHDAPRRGGKAPDPMKSDVGRTDDVPQETAGRTGAQNMMAEPGPQGAVI